MAKDVRLMIRGGRVLTPGADPDVPATADILIEGSRIAAVAPSLAEHAADRIIDANGKLVIPGLVNTHYHSHDLLLRGMFEELPLEFWGLYAQPASYPPRSREELRIRTLLGAIECLRGGITTVQDMLSLAPLEPAQLEVVLDAYAEAGIRVVFAAQVLDRGPAEAVPFWGTHMAGSTTSFGADAANRVLDTLGELYKAYGSRHDLQRWALGPSGPQRCSLELLRGLADFSERHNLPVFTHLYETKAQALHARQRHPDRDGSLVRYLGQAGLLDRRLTVAHAVWLRQDEIELLAAHDVGAVLNPMSNLKLKSGIAPLRALQASGMRLALGCDNCSCSDAQNMFQAMKMFALLAAVDDPAPGVPLAAAALRAATTGGAAAAGMGDDIGEIAPGKKADLAIVDLADPVFVPLNSATRQLVYGECGRGVETVLVDGRVVVENRRVVTIDEAALHRAAAELMPALRRDFAEVARRNEALLPGFIALHRQVWEQDVGVHRFVGAPRF